MADVTVHSCVGLLGLLFWLTAVAPAAAQLSTSSGVRGPATFPDPILPMDDAVVYAEASNVTLPDLEVNILPVDGSYDGLATAPTLPLPGGRVVSCYLIHFESEPLREITGEIRVDDGFELVAVIATAPLLLATDDLCKPRADIEYSTNPDRGSLGASGDLLVLEESARRMSLTLVQEENPGAFDQIRLFVATVEAPDAGTGSDAGPAAAADAGIGPSPPPAWDYRGSGGCTCSTAGSSRPHDPSPTPLALLALAAWTTARARRTRTPAPR